MANYTLWLVMLNGGNFVDMGYKDRYKLFDNPKDALEWAKKNGYENDYFGISTKIGQLNQYMCGDKEIGIISIEVKIK